MAYHGYEMHQPLHGGVDMMAPGYLHSNPGAQAAMYQQSMQYGVMSPYELMAPQFQPMQVLMQSAMMPGPFPMSGMSMHPAQAVPTDSPVVALPQTMPGGGVGSFQGMGLPEGQAYPRAPVME